MEESFVIQKKQSKVLGAKTDEIGELFNVEVELQGDPNSDDDDGIQWVSIKGQASTDVTDAKKYVIALCNPELNEHISFPGFPLFLFAAFKERIKQMVQREFGVVLYVTEDGFIDISGSDIGVTLAISKIQHLHKLNRDKDNEKARLEALQFDVHVNKIGDSYQGKLKSLSNVLKKEILNLLGVAVPSTNGETMPKVINPASPSTVPKVINLASPSTVPKVINLISPSTSRKTEPEIIVIDHSSQEDDVEVISSSESEEDSDYEEGDAAPSRLRHDGIDNDQSAAYVLPPNFVIREWIKANYEGTSDSTDFVNKNDMLRHFQTHFDLPSHPDLANTFFDKLAVQIFPRDQNYRSVKTKKSKSKQGKRRLICLRKRLTSDADVASVPGLRQATVSPIPRQPTVMPPVHQSVSKAASPLRHLTPLQQPSSLMSDWNSNRPGMPKSPTVVQRPAHPHFERQWNPAPTRPAGNAGPGAWMTQPVPKPRVQPRMQRQTSQVMKSLATRVSEMSNDELIKKPRPKPDQNLRHIIIDGSNVAMGHGNHSKFSCRGIALCARFFIERGHEHVTCFVPNFRKGGGGQPPSNDHYLLMQLESMGVLKATPSRRINGQNIVCYDDRFIVELAESTNGVILSNDQYRDLMMEDRRWKPVIEQQLLQFTIVGDLLMLPEDPLGRDGPSLENFLMKPRNGRTTQPQQKVVRVPAPARPRQAPLQRPPANAAKPPLLPTPFNTMLPQRQPLPPVANAWMHQPTNLPHVLSPDQHMLAYAMMEIFPDKENAIKKVITEHPLIKNIEELLDILIISDTGT